MIDFGSSLDVVRAHLYVGGAHMISALSEGHCCASLTVVSLWRNSYADGGKFHLHGVLRTARPFARGCENGGEGIWRSIIVQ